MTLIHGDCSEKLQDMSDKSIDLIVTDPPYGIDYQTFRTKREKLANDDNLDWLSEFAGHCGCLLKHEHHMYCFVDAEYSADFILAFRQKGFKLRNILTIPRAVKGNGGDRIFQQQFEFCLFMTLGSKDEGRKFNETKILRPSEGYVKDKRFASKDWLYRLPDHWYWTTASEHNLNSKLHPTQKNVKCLMNMIELSSNENEVVLDPFMGSGSTGVACVNTNRQFIGIEISEQYFASVQERIIEAEKRNKFDRSAIFQGMSESNEVDMFE